MPNRRSRPTRNELLAALFELDGTEFTRCLAPPPWCDQPAIRAHSVQNARALDLLAQDGHVVALTRRTDAQTGPEIDFAPIGRNRATTFSGLCAKHDQDIFAPVDRATFDPENPQHLFLLAYRATYHETHATCAAGIKLQLAYQKRVELGLDHANGPSPAGLIAIQRLLIAWETFNFKAAFDVAYLSGDYSLLLHDVLPIKTRSPTVGACSLFSIDDAARGGEHSIRACLNVFPATATQTFAILSYVAADAPVARAALSRLLDARGAHQAYEVSRRLLNSCENIVLSPAYFGTWTERKRQTVRDYFVRTLLQDDRSTEDIDLNLFQDGA